jgi:predicted dehydrogenase
MQPTTSTSGQVSAQSVRSRRDFLRNTGLATGFLLLPSGFLRGETAPSNRINVASIGVTGMGDGDIRGVRNAGGNIIALCDVNSRNLAGARRGFPEAQAFEDYRVMFDKLGKDIDAVTVSTPDHTHFSISLAAVESGKHVYVQKPMCHTVDQIRRLTKAATERNIVSQMGNQGHSSQHIRLVREWYEAGLFGEISEVSAWTTQPLTPTQREGSKAYRPHVPVPSELNWDLWLGPVSFREYSPDIAPQQWRAYYEFGCGSLGDMAAHIIDPAYYALDLGAPEKIEFVSASSQSEVSFPDRCKLVYHFPGNGKRGPVKLSWSQGRGPGVKPPVPAGLSLPEGGGLARRQADGLTMSGSIFHGKQVTFSMGQYGDFFFTAPASKLEELKPKAPAIKYPRPKGGHYRDWVDAIREGRKAVSDFSYAGPLTEVIQLGVIAQRVQRTLNWDARAGKFINDDEANKFLVAPVPREGFKA